MLTETRSVPWQEIYAQKFLLEDQCWTTCNGGYCCSNNHPDFNFQFMPMHGTTILYMEEEYDWLAEHGKVFDPQTSDSVPNVVSIDFGGPRPLALIQMPCRLLGKCQGIVDKPLLCKLYPMLPVLDVDGALEDVAASSIFELTMLVRGFKTPCTVVDKKRHYLTKWKNAPQCLDSLRHPYIILYLQAAKHFAETYTEKLRASETLKELTGKAFWSAWEFEYLLGNLIDADQLAAKIAETHRELVERHGPFLKAA